MDAAAAALNNLLALIGRRRAGRAGPLLLALDGRSGSGKSTLAAGLVAAVGASVVDGDDFYAGGADADWDRRSAAEKAARCIDWRRLRAEALEPLLRGQPAAWHPFDFHAGSGLAAHLVTRAPAPVLVLDGVYSARPELADLVDVAVLVVVADAVRRRRLLAREGVPFMAAWHRRWDEAEAYYFTQIRPPSSFDLVLTSG